MSEFTENCSNVASALLVKTLTELEQHMGPVRASAAKRDDPWPEPMREEAFHGLAGEFVRLVLPESEADPHALLLTLLAGLGCLMGRHSFYRVEDSRHHPNLFVVVVGDSAKARKGTATDRVLKLLEAVDPEFSLTRKASGLSSGEGLIFAVRDARKDDVNVADKGTPQRYEQQVTDPGVADKRLLLVETELAHPLQAAMREGSTLSPILRDAWDGKSLRITSKQNRDSCQQPHVSIIGNITVDELRRLLTANDKANGFANRFLWCCCRRSKLLPCGGNEVSASLYRDLVGCFQCAIAKARFVGEVTWSRDAKDLWTLVYEELSAPEKGAPRGLEALTARAEAQCVRLAMLYALLDESTVIRPAHLKAAIAVWEYCADSVKHIFASDEGDSTQSKIIRALTDSPDGMTKTEINKAHGGHVRGRSLDEALDALERAGRLSRRVQKTAGASVTRYHMREAS